MVIEYDKDEKHFTIDTNSHDPIMVVGLLQAKMSEAYEITVQGDAVEIQQIAYIEL